jgi:hypothetical protein
MAGSSECGNELSCSIGCRELIDYLKACHLLKKNSVPWTWLVGLWLVGWSMGYLVGYLVSYLASYKQLMYMCCPTLFLSFPHIFDE